VNCKYTVNNKLLPVTNGKAHPLVADGGTASAPCVRIYRSGRRLNILKVSFDLFGIIPVVGSTNRICRSFSVAIF
jgi:molecular chaperone DnaK (HSP70)